MYTMKRRTAERLANNVVQSESLADLQKDVGKLIDARCKRTIDAHNHITSSVTPMLFVGDFVYICRPNKPFHKLALTCTGPRRFVAVKRFSAFVLQDLIPRKQETVHLTQIHKYDGLTVGEKVQDEDLGLADQTATKYEIDDKSLHISRNAKDIWLRVR